jgi:Raf kinase inhibitor-like YbhB/YbcL family protein
LPGRRWRHVSIANNNHFEANTMQVRSLLAALMLTALCGPALAQTPAPDAPHPPSGMHAVMMRVTSSAVEDGGILPDIYSAKNNQPGKPAGSPPVAWTGAPAGTQSFVLIMHDIDVVVGKTTGDNLHWLAFNIPASVTSLPAGVPKTATLADGTVQPILRGANGFDGPGAPANGPYHHYVFDVWALDAKLPLDASASRDDVLKAMDGHVLDKGTLVARFHR